MRYPRAKRGNPEQPYAILNWHVTSLPTDDDSYFMHQAVDKCAITAGPLLHYALLLGE
jgi:hypothetical protein